MKENCGVVEGNENSDGNMIAAIIGNWVTYTKMLRATII